MPTGDSNTEPPADRSMNCGNGECAAADTGPNSGSRAEADANVDTNSNAHPDDSPSKLYWHDVPGIVKEPFTLQRPAQTSPNAWMSPSFIPLCCFVTLMFYAVARHFTGWPVEWFSMIVTLGLYAVLTANVFQTSKKHRSNQHAISIILPITIIMSALISLGLIIAIPDVYELTVQFSTMFIMFALILLIPAALRRIGTGLHCIACDYEYTWTDPQGPEPPDQCPECGNHWHRRNGLARGRKHQYRTHMVAGLSAGIIFFFVFPFFGRHADIHMRVISTNALISHVATPGARLVSDEWKELGRRTLTADQTERLFTDLLDLRDESLQLSREAQEWIDAQITNNAVTKELVDRYHAGMLELWLKAPDAARVGEPIGIEVHVRTRQSPFGPRDPCFVIVGYTVNGTPIDATRRSRSLEYPNGVATKIEWFGKIDPGSGSAATTITPDRPGELQITLHHWVAIVPQFGGGALIGWVDETTPAFPTNLLHAERREATITITVSQ